MPKRRYSFEFWALPKDIAQSTKLSLIDKVVLSSFITRANGENTLRIKQKTIADDWGISHRHVKRSIATLRKIGYLESDRLGKTLCNRYQIKI